MTALPMSAPGNVHRVILTDSGRASSSHPLEDNDCSVRTIANTTGLSYDEAHDELTASGYRIPLDGIDWQEWARKVGTIQAPWTGQPHWYYRHISLGATKGFPRIKARDLPSLFPVGAWAMTSKAHVEAWVNGKHYDTDTAARTLNSTRVIYGAWECRRVARDQRMFMAWRGYYMNGAVPAEYDPADMTEHQGRPCYRSALGPIAATSYHEAYALAEKWYGHRIMNKNSDLLVTRV